MAAATNLVRHCIDGAHLWKGSVQRQQTNWARAICEKKVERSGNHGTLSNKINWKLSALHKCQALTSRSGKWFEQSKEYATCAYIRTEGQRTSSSKISRPYPRKTGSVFGKERKFRSPTTFWGTDRVKTSLKIKPSKAKNKIIVCMAAWRYLTYSRSEAVHITETFLRKRTHKPTKATEQEVSHPQRLGCVQEEETKKCKALTSRSGKGLEPSKKYTIGSYKEGQGRTTSQIDKDNLAWMTQSNKLRIWERGEKMDSPSSLKGTN